MIGRAERIPLAGTSTLHGAAGRSRALRVSLALGTIAALAGALAFALDRPEFRALLPPGSDGVIVLDVSASVGPRDYRQLTQALDEANSQRRRYGLVVFSDVAYEVFPPGTDPGQVRAVRRYFVPSAERGRRRIGTTRVEGELYLQTPWAAAFTGGTRISRGLALAREIVERDRLVDPAVLLISDVDYDARDVDGIEQVVSQYARDRIRLQIVALAPASRMERFFDTFPSLRRSNVATPVNSVVGARSEERYSASAPLALAAAGLILLVLLALNELACGRLTWSPATRGGSR